MVYRRVLRVIKPTDLKDSKHLEVLSVVACKERGFTHRIPSLSLRQTCRLVRDEFDSFLAQSTILNVQHEWLGDPRSSATPIFKLPDLLARNVRHVHLSVIVSKLAVHTKRWPFDWICPLKSLRSLRLAFVSRHIDKHYDIVTKDTPALRCILADIYLKLASNIVLDIEGLISDQKYWVGVDPEEVKEAALEMKCVLPASRSVTVVYEKAYVGSWTGRRFTV